MIDKKPTWTLNKIRRFKPCESGLERLKRYLGDDYGDDAPITIEQIMEAVGVRNAIWGLRVISDEHISSIVEFANECANRANKYAGLRNC